MIAALMGGAPVPTCAVRILGVASTEYFRWKRGPVPQAELRRRWLRNLIVGGSSCVTYGSQGIRAARRRELGVAVSWTTLQKLTNKEEIAGLPESRHRKNLVNVAILLDFVKRTVRREAPHQGCDTGIIGQPTREGKLYFCAVVDAHSPGVVGRPADTRQASWLVTNALSMALTIGVPTKVTAIYADHGTHFTRWGFTKRAKPPWHHLGAPLLIPNRHHS
ncbi:MAG: hypothetical protein ACRENX_04200 [Candidatus Dormibacteria bacterium]